MLACASVLGPRRARPFITGADWLQDPRMFAVPASCAPCTALPVYRSSLGCHILPSEDRWQPPPRAASPSTLLCSCPSSLWPPLMKQRQGAGSHLPRRGHSWSLAPVLTKSITCRDDEEPQRPTCGALLYIFCFRCSGGTGLSKCLLAARPEDSLLSRLLLVSLHNLLRQEEIGE